MKIKHENGVADTVSVEIVNKKLEAFVDILLGKMQEMQIDLKKQSNRIRKLEKLLNGKEV